MLEYKPDENVDNTVAEQIKEEATTDPAVLLGWQVRRIFMWSTCYHIVNTVIQKTSFGYRKLYEAGISMHVISYTHFPSLYICICMYLYYRYG